MRSHVIGGAAAVILAAAWCVPLSGQTAPARPAMTTAGAPVKAAAGKRWTVPHTAWGHPDLQGLWNNGTPTPLERPADLAGREFLTDEEWAARAKVAATRAVDRPADAAADVALAYDAEWWDPGAPLKRTSLIVEPASGMLPALTAEGQRLVAARASEARKRGPADSWEDRPLQERCLLYHGVPPMPTGYNNNYLVVQTRDYVAIRYEMLAETRIIPLDGRPHLASGIQQWTGDSRGRFEGDTLVVETTNFSPKTTFRFPVDHATLKIVERFTRTADNAIDYRFTVENPTMYTQAWSAVLPFAKAPGPIYEYACHEGNHGLEHVLRGHRFEEQQAQEKAKAKQSDNR